MIPEADLPDLRAKLRDGIEALSESLLGEPNRALSSRREKRWGSHGSLKVDISGQFRGRWHSFEDGTGGDALALIQRLKGTDFPGAVEWAQTWLGQPHATLRPQKPEKPKHARKGGYGPRLDAEAMPIDPGTVAEGYGTVRGLSKMPPELRFHQAVWSHETKSHHPAIIVRCCEGGQLARLQAILLDPATGGKAALVAPKLTFGAGKAHVPATFAARVESDWIALTEGPEDAWTVWSVMGWRTDASLGAGSLSKPRYPAGTNLIIVGDNGETGRKQAEEAAQKHAEAGVNVWVVFPPDGIKDVNDLLRERGPEAVRALIEGAIAADPPPVRPTVDMAEVQDLVHETVKRWAAGEGYRHLLLSTATGSGKGYSPMRLLADRVKAERQARQRFLRDYRLSHPGCPADEAAKAADKEGLKVSRIAYVGSDHGLVAQFIRDAREQGLIAAHDAGIDRPYDPDPKAENSPPRCTQPDRMRQTQLAGEPVKVAACGVDLNGPHCPDRGGCRYWQALDECAHAEFVGMVAERATGWHLARQLQGFDYILFDEPPDRVFFREAELMLDLAADHLFGPHPVLGERGLQDPETTEAARAGYARFRSVIDASPNGYWPIEAFAAAGCDSDFFDQLVAWTDARDRPTGMTPATSDDARREMARASFRNAVRSLCSLFRLAAEIMRGEHKTGRIEIAGEAPRMLVVRKSGEINPSLLKARILVTGAGLELQAVRRWLPEAVEITGEIPRTPNQKVVHFHKGAGIRAMRDPMRLRWCRSLISLYGDDSREGATGVLTHAEHEHAFTNVLNGAITGHHGAVVGRNDWKNCSTFFNFGLRSLSPEAAAALGAARTGEPVPIWPMRQVKRRVALANGRSVHLPVMEYEDPAAQEAQRSVNTFDAIQGILGRPRGANRTSENPVTLFDVGWHPLPNTEIDVLITSSQQFAPPRFVAMMSEGLAVEHSLSRNRMHPAIYQQTWDGQNDKRLEKDGFLATAMRVICPPWCTGPREAWVVGRYSKKGRARRTAGQLFISTERQLALNVRLLCERDGADPESIVIERVIRPAGTTGEVAINRYLTDISGTIASSQNRVGDSAIPPGIGVPHMPHESERRPDT